MSESPGSRLVTKLTVPDLPSFSSSRTTEPVTPYCETTRSLRLLYLTVLLASWTTIDASAGEAASVRSIRSRRSLTAILNPAPLPKTVTATKTTAPTTSRVKSRLLLTGDAFLSGPFRTGSFFGSFLFSIDSIVGFRRLASQRAQQGDGRRQKEGNLLAPAA